MHGGYTIHTHIVIVIFIYRTCIVILKENVGYVCFLTSLPDTPATGPPALPGPPSTAGNDLATAVCTCVS